jgi:DegV family protein with EDD domain
MLKKKYVIVTDSHCDLKPDDFPSFKNYFHIIPMPYAKDCEESFNVFLTKEESEKFYAEMKKGGHYTTSALSVDFYKHYFEQFLSQDLDIIYVHLSSKMSSTVINAKAATHYLQKSYPDRKVFFIDSMAVTSQMYCVVTDILNMSMTVSKAAILVKRIRLNKVPMRYKTYFTVENLDYFARSGRVSNIAAFLSKSVGIYPLMTFEDGEIKIVKKVLGKQRILKEIMKRFMCESKGTYPRLILVKNGDEFLNTKIAKTLELDTLKYSFINPTTGVHCGPGTFGITFEKRIAE